ncbi:MAG TPA: Ig-like domain-containing protein [Micromonosporaceae bacterium]|nr:Ig-like domain-containing protein [Micromonosporaceae bacterium]
MAESPERTAPRRTRVRAVLAALAAVLVVAAGCSGDDEKPSSQDGSSPKPKPRPAAARIVEPAADAKDVPTSTAVAFETKNPGAASVQLKNAAGEIVKGSLQAGGKTWLPAGQLDYATRYTVSVTAPGEDGKPSTTTSSFTTMDEPANQVRVSSFLGDGQVVGVGMPLMVRFGREIPEDYRDDVERRMAVRAKPAQEGVWHWVSGTEVRYRPKTYWKANTAVSYKLQTGGLPMGKGWYGAADITVDLKIGPSVVMTVDNRTKRMTVVLNGKVVRAIPVSLGKPRTPSSSGTMLVLEKLRKTVFDTRTDPNPADRYRINIEYAQRLTWSGEFIHSAPWSVPVQGKTNVSHGCVNMSPANAAWLFGITRMGDPVTVKGTERRVAGGNGWTDWNMSWDEYVKGSAVSN